MSDNTITNIAPASNFSESRRRRLCRRPIVNIEIAANLIRRQITPTIKTAWPGSPIRIIERAGGINCGAGFTV